MVEIRAHAGISLLNLPENLPEKAARLRVFALNALVECPESLQRSHNPRSALPSDVGWRGRETRLYSNPLSGAGQIMRGMVDANSTDYASAVARMEKIAKKSLERLISSYEKNSQP